MDLVERLQEVLANLLGNLADGLLSVLGGLLVLLVFYIAARLVAGLVRRLLKGTGLDNRIAGAVGGEEAAGKAEDFIAGLVFWIIMILGLVGFFQRVNLEFVAEPINTMIRNVLDFLPNILAAGILLVIGWILMRLVRTLATQAGNTLGIDQRLSQYGALKEGERVSITESLAMALGWLVFLFFVPAALDALNLQGLLEPVQGMFNQMLGFVPNIIGAVVIGVIGWFIARILRQIVTNLLAATGVDAVGERLGLGMTTSLSNLLGTVVYTLVLIPTLITALDTLSIDAISGPATAMLNTVMQAIPAVFGAIIVLGVSYFIARLISNLIVDLLTGVGFNRMPDMLGIKMGGERTPAQFVGYVVIVLVMMFAAIEAAGLLGFDMVAGLVTTFIGFASQVVVGLVIFAFGLYFANLAHSLVMGAGGSQASFSAAIARLAILVFAGAMALRQMGLADDIVNLAFGIMLGSLGIAVALAFGLGSREIAGREMDRFVSGLRGDDDASEEPF